MKLKIFLLFSLIFFLSFFTGHFTFASGFSENFDLLNLGSLNGQNGWISTSGSVVNSLYRSAGQSFALGTAIHSYHDIGEEHDSVEFSFYVKSTFNYNNASMGYPVLYMQNGTAESVIIQISNGSVSGFRLFLNDGSNYLTPYDNILFNEWHTLKIIWDNNAETFNFQLDGGNSFSGYGYKNQGAINRIRLMYAQHSSEVFLDDISIFTSVPDFAITSPGHNQAIVNDSWIMVEGTCPADGTNQIAFTNDCSDFSNLNYTVDCVNGTFSDDFYYNGISDWVVAVDKKSIAGDCVDYDDLMDGVQVYGIEVIEGYPDDWYFNFNYYDDYDIKINYPVFNTALTLPLGSTGDTFSFNFVYPQPLAPNLAFKILQYDSVGNLLDGNYNSINLTQMSNTSDYQALINASSTADLHYVVQLWNGADLVRQYPFMVAVSDLDIIVNSDDFHYLFPRLVEELKTKVIFNYYFAFYDGFYDMFNTPATSVAEDAMDITFQSMSDDGQYDLDIPIFSASDKRVKDFTEGLRPWITALLWLLFALYVVFRITHLFSDND